MGELDSIMKSLVDYDQIFQFHEQALSDIAQKVKRGEKIVSGFFTVPNIYSQRFRPTLLGLMKLGYSRRKKHMKRKHPGKSIARWTTT